MERVRIQKFFPFAWKLSEQSFDVGMARSDSRFQFP
jgi:hypothetical protein